MLAFVPVTLDIYRTADAAHLQWTMQSSSASPTAPGDASLRCARSPRSLDCPRARCPAIWRNLVECGVIARQRRPGGVYDYQIDPRSCRARGCPTSARGGCPTAGGNRRTDQLRKRGRRASALIREIRD